MDSALANWLADHHGVVSRAWLTEAGYTPGRIRSLLETGMLVAMQRGVYIAACSPRSERQRLATMCVAYDAVASHTSAGSEWRFRRLGRPTGLHVVFPQGAHVNPRRRCHAPDSIDVTVHHSANLLPCDIQRQDDGILVTSPARTVFDLSSVLRPHNLESVIEQGLSENRFTIDDLVRIGERLCRRGREGSTRFNEVLGSRPKDQRPAASDLEVRFARAWEAARLPRLERQHPVPLASGVILHPDFAEPGRRFLVEVDHSTWHAGRQENMTDRWRDRQYHLLGWHSERVTEDDINRRLAVTISELASVYHALPDSPSTPSTPY